MIAQDFRPQRVLAPESVAGTTFEGVLIRKAVSYWEIRTKEAFSSPDFVIVVW